MLYLTETNGAYGFINIEFKFHNLVKILKTQSEEMKVNTNWGFIGFFFLFFCQWVLRI